MNTKIKNTLFFLMCFSLIFENIPQVIRLSFIGGPVGSKLLFYPLFAGIVYTAYCESKYKNILVHKEKVFKYLGIYLGVTLLSLLLGLYNFPYYSDILQGPPDQIEKLPKVLVLLNSFGIAITHQQLLTLWMFARPIKGLLLDAFYTIGTSYMIYCWYKEDWQEGFRVMCKGAIASLLVAMLYSSIEVCYLAGNKTATDILTTITPYIHVVNVDHNWWPPLLWKGQLRSTLSEPSRVGNYLAMVLPIIWYGIFSEKRKKASYILLFLFNGMIFLTQARTAVIMYLGMYLFLAIIYLICFEKEKLKKLIAIFVVSSISFGASLYFISNFVNASKSVTKGNIAVVNAVDNYIESNVASLGSSNKRSNSARYAYIKANFRTGMQSPLLGVGKGLTAGYTRDNFTEQEKRGEVKRYLENQEREGLLRYTIDAMNEYVTRFAEIGILGLAVFLSPFAYILYCLGKTLLCKKAEDLNATVCMFLSLIGTLVAGMNGSLNMLFTIWITLGIAYAMCFGKEQESKDNL